MNVPRLSVVIAASDGPSALARVVASVRSQADPVAVEIIVAAARDRIEPEAMPAGVERVSAPEGTGVPRLRRLGLERANAPIVVYTEDSCVVRPGWLDSWRKAFANPEVAAATGPVEPAMGHSPVDWAVFFCEYAPFLTGSQRRSGDGQPGRLAGNNFAVRRTGAATLEGSEIQEFEVHHEIRTQRRLIVEVEGAVAAHVRRYALWEAFGDRWRFGQEFGRLRARSSNPLSWTRNAAILAGPAILAILLARLTVWVFSGGRYRGRFVLTLPFTLAFLSAWSAGEAVGWTLGDRRANRAGKPHERVVRPRARSPVRPG